MDLGIQQPEPEQKPERPKRLMAASLVAAGLALVVAAVGVVSSIESGKQREAMSAEMSKVAADNQKLSDSLQSLRTESDEASATLAEVAKGLEEIRIKELHAIRSSINMAQEGSATGRRSQLEAEIASIRTAVHANLQKLARLEKADKANKYEMASLRTLADELKKSLEEKATTVAALETKVGELSKTIETQASSLNEKDAVLREKETRIAEKTKEANTAYIAVASKSVLADKGVVEKRGDILGVGGRWIETGKFDPGVFREVDVTKDLSVDIPAPAAKVRVVSEQPKGSYAVVAAGPNATTSRLEVKDPAAFWKGERYLVVMIPD